MDPPARRCHDGAAASPGHAGAAQPEDTVMSVPHGPIDLLLAAALSLLLAALAAGTVFA